MSTLVNNLFKRPGACATGHFYWLDLVRGVAAVAVLVWHYQHFYYGQLGQDAIVWTREAQPFYGFLALFYEHGYYAVQMFWAISGFVFSSVYARAHRPVSGREFFVNRFARLYPLHFLTLLLVAGLQAVSLMGTGEYQIYPYNDAYHFGLHLFFVSHWGLEIGDSFNQPIWSVSIEVFIYFVFWLALGYVFRFGIVGPLLMACAFMVLVVARIEGPFWECGLYFFIGSAAYLWLVAFQTANGITVAVAALGASGAALVLWLGFPHVGYVARLVFSASVVLLAASIDAKDMRRRGRAFASLGDLTYSIYLLHIPVQIFLILAIRELDIGQEVFSSGYLFIIFMALVVLLSIVSHRYYERPVREYLRRRWARRRDVVRKAVADRCEVWVRAVGNPER